MKQCIRQHRHSDTAVTKDSPNSGLHQAYFLLASCSLYGLLAALPLASLLWAQIEEPSLPGISPVLAEGGEYGVPIQGLSWYLLGSACAVPAHISLTKADHVAKPAIHAGRGIKSSYRKGQQIF